MLNGNIESSDDYSSKLFERMDIKKWSIFCALNDEFINTVNVMAVFGTMGEKALVITETDDVYIIGKSSSFSMNVLYDSTFFKPKHRPELSRKGLKGFAFAHNICLAYNELGKLFCWENNSSIFSAVCNKEQITDLSSSCKELCFKRISDVVYSTTHGLVLCSDGEVFAIRKEPDIDSDNKNSEIFSRNNLNCNEDQKVTNVSTGSGAPLCDSLPRKICYSSKHASTLKTVENANTPTTNKLPSSTGSPITTSSPLRYVFSPSVPVPTTFSFSSVTTNACTNAGTTVTNTTNGVPVFSGKCELSSTAQSNTTAKTTPEIKIENVIKGKIAVGIACTDNVSFILLHNGEVLSCSLNENVGGKESNALCSLTLVESLSEINIKKLVCGFSYVLALNDLGQVFTWSVDNANVNGELGRLSNDFKKPAMVSKLNNIIDVAAVKYCRISVALDSNYKIYVWGLCNGQNVREPMLTHFCSIHDVFAQLASPSVTCTYLNAKCTKEQTVLDDITNAFDRGDTADVTILVEDTKIKAHKAILKIRCSHFKNLLEDVNENGVLTINGHKHAVYATFLKYLYTGEINISEESMFDLFELAREYQEVKVQNKCIQIMKHSVSVKTVIPIYLKGIEKSKELEHFCVEFIMNNLNEVVNGDSFKKLDHELIKNIFIEVARRRLFKT